MRTLLPCLLLLASASACGDASSAADAAADVNAVDISATDVPRADVVATADASSSCGARTCPANEICLRQRTLGGALQLPDDAGACPAGRHLEGGSCQSDFTYYCVTRPACADYACACLSAICPTSHTCRDASSALLTCELLAP